MRNVIMNTTFWVSLIILFPLSRLSFNFFVVILLHFWWMSIFFMLQYKISWYWRFDSSSKFFKRRKCNYLTHNIMLHKNLLYSCRFSWSKITIQKNFILQLVHIYFPKQHFHGKPHFVTTIQQEKLFSITG